MSGIVVVGCNSFSGSHFVNHCLKLGHSVLGISRSDMPNAAFLPHLWEKSDIAGRFSFLKARLPEDIDNINNAIASFECDYVVNFAALGMVAESWLYPADYYKTNLLGNVVLHESLRKLTSLKKYVHISTPEVYGNTSGYITESAAFKPSTPYAASRAACDIHLKTFLDQYHFPVVWTRAANVFGPGQQLYRIVPRTLLAGFLDKKLQLHGGGTSTRSFIHIEDVCRATLSIAENADSGGVFHLSTMETISIRGLVDRICRICGWKFEDIVEMADERPGADSAYLLDSSQARNTFGWKDEISLDQGIIETRQWIESNLEYFKTLTLNYEHKN